MSLRFSLRDLLILVGLVCVACAALANPGIWWQSIVASVTLLGMTILLLAAAILPGRPRTFAIGWLLFASAYLALVFAPWTSAAVGPNLVTSKGLGRLEAFCLGETPSMNVLPDAASPMGQGGVDLLLSGSVNINSVNSGRLLLDLGLPLQQQAYSPPTMNCTTFQSTGHWLLASVFGFLGARLALAFRGRESTPKSA